jgi:hypothetical protein
MENAKLVWSREYRKTYGDLLQMIIDVVEHDRGQAHDATLAITDEDFDMVMDVLLDDLFVALTPIRVRATAKAPAQTS